MADAVNELEQALGALAIERGLINAAQLAECVELREAGSAERLPRLLISKGYLDPTVAAALEREIDPRTTSATIQHFEESVPLTRKLEKQPVFPTPDFIPTLIESGATNPLVGSARRYQDGKLTTGGDVPEGEAERFVELPYKSSDVLRRMGTYDVLEQIGEGGMGVVYRAYSLQLCRECAIKVVRPTRKRRPADIVRLQNEAMLAARISHPNIVPVFDAGRDGESFYFVMEYVPGSTLLDLILEAGPQALERGVAILVKVARALEVAHQKGIIHRDIKPENILLTADGEPRITDFGVAVTAEQDDETLTGRAGSAVGTPDYMPPEQAIGELESVGPQSDVHALGATLYHLLTGQVPWRGTTLQIICQVISEEPASPRAVAAQHGRNVPLDLETICLKAMEKQIARRYDSAAAFADDLEAFLADRPIQARPISRTERLQKFVRRNHAVVAGAAILFAVLLTMAISFGTVVSNTLRRSTVSMREQDEAAALDQAETLERAIRVNMLQGRADLARELLAKLREDKNLNQLLVIRTDRTLAYTDLATRQEVAKRLSDPDVLEWIRAEHPDAQGRIEALTATGFAEIDANERKREVFEYDAFEWKGLLRAKEIVTTREVIDGVPTLIVLKPILNSAECRVCHDVGDDPRYPKDVRAVLAVYRSQADVEARIRANNVATLSVGAATTFVALVLILVFGRLFGIGLRPRRFGAA